jgi:hypothetical protein
VECILGLKNTTKGIVEIAQLLCRLQYHIKLSLNLLVKQPGSEQACVRVKGLSPPSGLQWISPFWWHGS